ncbi:MAG: transposase [Methanophagales archaeon]|jgi:hypothetical protein|nr:transposase [Methanophagales archaeon]
MAEEIDFLTIESADSDLIIRLDDAQREQPGDSTYRDHKAPELECGKHFYPLRVSNRAPVISQLPPTALSLFQHFIPISLIEEWVRYTNQGSRAGPVGPDLPHARRQNWTDTTVEEVYIWIGTLIYMGIHPEKRYQDYWKTPSPGELRPSHPVSQFMPYDRFQLLQRQLRIFKPEDETDTIPRPFSIVDNWSKIVQEASLRFYQPGTNITVDECIVGFTGRSRQTVTIPTKPTPTGFKIWVIGQRGYFMHWLWHLPKVTYDSLTLKRGKKRKFEEELPALNPTQSVVVDLVNQLPNATYHVALDNLFTSAPLLRVLRKRDIAATGTCRTNCGIYAKFVKAKADDSKGICWPHGTVHSAPTPDGEVRDIRS